MKRNRTQTLKLTCRTIDLGPHTIRLNVPADPDQILRDAINAAQVGGQAADPYWGLLWAAATPMARLVLQHNWSDGACAIELGCGVGLVGIAGLIAGLDVTFTDLVPDAVSLAIQNAADNGFAEARGQVLDWRLPQHEPVDVLLASDVLYDVSCHRPLLAAARQLLHSDGTLWIGDPGREGAKQFLHTAGGEWSVRLFGEDGHAIVQPQRGRFQLIEMRGPVSRQPVQRDAGSHT